MVWMEKAMENTMENTVESTVENPTEGTMETRRQVSDLERWSMAAGGGILAACGLLRGGKLGNAVALIGGALAVQGWRGRVLSPIARQGVAEAAVTIGAPPDAVFEFFRDIDRVAAAIPQLESVERRGDNRAHWVVQLPAGVRLRGDARIVGDEHGHRIAWQTEGPTTVEHEGEVVCEAAPAGRGTEVRVRIKWRDPTGGLVQWLAKCAGGITGCAPRDELRRSLESVKQVLETGERATAAMRPLAAAGDRRAAPELELAPETT